MPNLEILAYEPDGEGGWFVHWRNPADLDGEPLEAFFHATPKKVAALVEIRRQLHAPETPMVSAREVLARDRETMWALPEQARRPDRQRAELGIPDGVTPYAVLDWLDGYDTHVTDSLDRRRLNVHGGAPHGVLEAARTGEAIPPQWRRVASNELSEFAKRRGSTDG